MKVFAEFQTITAPSTATLRLYAFLRRKNKMGNYVVKISFYDAIKPLHKWNFVQDIILTNLANELEQ